MMEVSFCDLKTKYYQSIDLMQHNEDAALNENNPSHAKWLYHPTLVRWLYGSNKEVINDFVNISIALHGKVALGQTERIGHWTFDLSTRDYQFRRRVSEKFQGNKEIMEAIAK